MAKNFIIINSSKLDLKKKEIQQLESNNKNNQQNYITEFNRKYMNNFQIFNILLIKIKVCM